MGVFLGVFLCQIGVELNADLKMYGLYVYLQRLGGYLEFCVGNFSVKTRSLFISVKMDCKLFFSTYQKAAFLKILKIPAL